MNHVIAYELLAAELATYRDLGFEQLRQLVGDSSINRKHGTDAVEYEITVLVRWCDREAGDTRVTGTVSETGWGRPHDYLDDSFVVPRQTAGHA